MQDFLGFTLVSKVSVEYSSRSSSVKLKISTNHGSNNFLRSLLLQSLVVISKVAVGTSSFFKKWNRILVTGSY